MDAAAAASATATMSKPNAQPPQPPPVSLYKQKSWTPDIYRDEAWLRRKRAGRSSDRKRRSKSVTDEDVRELKACIELGFGFDSPEAELDHKLSDTLPALEFYYAVNKQYKNDAVPRSSSLSSTAPSSTSSSVCGSPPRHETGPTLFGPGENPQMMKTRLRQWAQVVACSVRQIS